MVGTVGDMAQALATLQHEQTRLTGQLQGEPAWQAWRQLDARESNGDPIYEVDSRALRARLAARLDGAVPGWRALAGIEAALAALSATPTNTPTPELTPIAITEPQSPPTATARVPDLLPRFESPAAGSILGSAAEARNRSLTQAIGTMHTIGAGEAATPTATTVIEPPSNRNGIDARAVLGRIRSVDGERRALAPEANVARSEVAPPPLPKAVVIAAKAPALTVSGTTRAIASAPPAAITKADPLPPPLPIATRPVAPAPEPVQTSEAAPSAPEASSSAPGPAETPVQSSALDSAARVAALEQELERLMQRNIEARKQLGPLPRPVSLALPSDAEELSDNLDEIFLDQAEIEIIPLAAGSQPDDATEAGIADADDGEESPGPLSLRLRRSQARQAAEAGSYAAYRGIIDEASVEIVQLDDAGSATGPRTASEPARQAPLRLVRDD